MPTVEGFTPQIAWTTLYGVIAVCLLFLILYKVYDAIHVIRERKRAKDEASKPDFAKKVGKEVLSELNPRLDKFEERLDSYEKRLSACERDIRDTKDGHREIHDGLSAIAKFMLVISNYGNFGDNDKIKEASTELQKFLAERL